MPPLNSLLGATLLALLLTLTAASSAVVDLIPSNFDKLVLQSGKPALVEFFAPWCGHCRNLAPVYEELGQVFASASDKVTIGKVDADENRELGKRFGIQGFPTIKYFDGKSATPVDYSGGRDLDSLATYVAEKSGVKPRGMKKEPSHVQMLGDQSWADVVGKDKNVLVAFTAPWCGHCKTLAPTWEALATDFLREDDVVIAKVDAEAENARALAHEQGVSGYPTIKFFPKGKGAAAAEAIPYQGARSEDAFVDFLNKQTGSRRAAGGGLNADAGKIAALDDVVAKHVSAHKPAELVAEVKKVAAGLEERYAPYYVKVAEKLAKDEDYPVKEGLRLSKILDKGGSAPEKVDDLVSRRNILGFFVGEDKERGAHKDEL